MPKVLCNFFLCICCFCAFTSNLSRCVLVVRADNVKGSKRYNNFSNSTNGTRPTWMWPYPLQITTSDINGMHHSKLIDMSLCVSKWQLRWWNQRKRCQRIGALIRGYRAGNQGYVVQQHARSLLQGRNTHCCSKVFKYYIHEYFTPFFA